MQSTSSPHELQGSALCAENLSSPHAPWLSANGNTFSVFFTPQLFQSFSPTATLSLVISLSLSAPPLSKAKG